MFLYTEQVDKYFSFEVFMKFYRKLSSSEDKKRVRINMYGYYLELREKLEKGTYKPLKFKCFYVTYPNPREIFSPAFSDRIIHHLLVSILYPITETFIFDSYANREGKGTHKAIERLQYFMRQIPQKDCYAFQCDIENYFISINKHIVFKLLFKHIEMLGLNQKDRAFVVFLLNRIVLQDIRKESILSGDISKKSLLPHHKSLFNQENHKGITAGALINQFISMVYLNEVDWYIKNQLKIKYYIRYVDDFIFIDNTTKNFDKLKQDLSLFLEKELGLALHPKKFKIQNVSKGIDYLGYIVRPHYILVRKRTISNLKEKLRFFNWLVNPKIYDSKKVKKIFERNSISKQFRNNEIKEGVKLDLQVIIQMLQTINSYYGILCKANTYNLRVFLYEKYFENLKEFFTPKNSFRAFILKPSVVKAYACRGYLS